MALTPQQLERQLTRLASRTPDRVLANAVRRGARRVVAASQREIASKGIGRAIWGANPRGLRKLVTVARARGESAVVETAIQAVGIPALMETGGQTKTHPIKPKRQGGVLAFMGSQGAAFARFVTNHRARINRQPSIEPELQRALPTIQREMTDSLDAWIDATTKF